MVLTVIIPVYNERETICEVLLRIGHVSLVKQIVVVDDGSTDGTADLLREEAERDPSLTLLTHPHNRGKGAAIRTALPHITGDIILIQDADLEYDPTDYPRLIAPILDGRADVVYGSRFVGSDAHRVLYFWHYMGNRFLTFLSNVFTNLNLSDMETGYKMFRTSILKQVPLKENGFGFEPEVTAGIARLKCRIFEVGIGYSGRTYAEGKKIGWRDGVHAIWCIFRYGLSR
jgi:glycosyltransferase involved in cell wall biosynthesis